VREKAAQACRGAGRRPRRRKRPVNASAPCRKRRRALLSMSSMGPRSRWGGWQAAEGVCGWRGKPAGPAVAVARRGEPTCAVGGLRRPKKCVLRFGERARRWRRRFRSRIAGGGRAAVVGFVGCLGGSGVRKEVRDAGGQ